jgi:hypothetical protein
VVFNVGFCYSLQEITKEAQHLSHVVSKAGHSSTNSGRLQQDTATFTIKQLVLRSSCHQRTAAK